MAACSSPAARHAFPGQGSVAHANIAVSARQAKWQTQCRFSLKHHGGSRSDCVFDNCTGGGIVWCLYESRLHLGLVKRRGWRRANTKAHPHEGGHRGVDNRGRMAWWRAFARGCATDAIGRGGHGSTGGCLTTTVPLRAGPCAGGIPGCLRRGGEHRRRCDPPGGRRKFDEALDRAFGERSPGGVKPCGSLSKRCPCGE